MLTKEKLIQIINDMPEIFSIDDLPDRILLLNKIETGLEQSENGQSLSTADAKEKLRKWLT